MRTVIFSFILIGSFFLSGCGYSTSSLLPSRLKTIHIDHVKNKVDYATEGDRKLYFPLMEVKIRNAVVDRFLFDGNLGVAEKDEANLILTGELINYEKNPLRFTEDDDVEEFRIHVVVNLVLYDVADDKVYWQESGFVGETTFFETGSLAVSESTAVEAAIEDLARRVVERTIEDW